MDLRRIRPFLLLIGLTAHAGLWTEGVLVPSTLTSISISKPPVIAVLLDVYRLASENDPCRLCEGDSFPKGLHLNAGSVDSIGRDLTDHNLHQIRRADSLLRTGQLGSRGRQESFQEALVYFQLRSRNGFHYFAELSMRTEQFAWGCGDGIVAPFRDTYCNAAVYPLRFIRRARLGANGFCMEYEIPERYDEHIQTSDLRLPVRRANVKLPNRGKIAVLSREFPTSDGKSLELLFESRVCGRVFRDSIIDRGDTLDLIALYDFQGLYARKWGVHKLGALVMWVDLVEGDKIPENPRLGACAHFPNIKFRLPSVLPDFDMSDLRDFAFPLPLMDKSWFSHPPESLTTWIEIQQAVLIKNWESKGPRQKILDELFPDQ